MAAGDVGTWRAKALAEIGQQADRVNKLTEEVQELEKKLSKKQKELNEESKKLADKLKSEQKMIDELAATPVKPPEA